MPAAAPQLCQSHWPGPMLRLMLKDQPPSRGTDSGELSEAIPTSCCGSRSGVQRSSHDFRALSASRGGIEKDTVAEYSGGFVPF